MEKEILKPHPPSPLGLWRADPSMRFAYSGQAVALVIKALRKAKAKDLIFSKGNYKYYPAKGHTVTLIIKDAKESKSLKTFF